MKFLIAGGSGFIGTHLAEFFLNSHHAVAVVARSGKHRLTGREGFRLIQADTTRPGDWQDAVPEADVVINLAGATIFRRWTKRYKQQIRDSRILTTGNLAEALAQGESTLFFSASATGYYGSQGDALLNEEASGGTDFLAQVAREWEQEAQKAEARGARVLQMRFGIVLGPGGGAWPKMASAFRFFLGGPLGNGSQWFPWIHIDDLAAAVAFCLYQESMSGPCNFCAPQPVRNRELARTMGKVLGRPAWLPAPGWGVRLVMGELGDTLMTSQNSYPEKLLQAGFCFRFPDLEGALQDLWGRQRSM